MAEAIVSFVVERLGELLMEKALQSISDNVQRLQTELKWMQCFLKDADASQQHGNETIQNMVAEVRDLAYDAEDVIESYAFAAESTKDGGFITALTGVPKSHKVALEIDEFTSKINELGRRLQIYGIRENGRGTHQNLELLRRRSYSHLAEKNVIGLAEDIEKIAKQLTGETLRSCAVSICGMGGVGKTTLAKEVYHDSRVRSHFSCFAWACVSQQFQIRDIWEGILVHLTSPSGKKRRNIYHLKDDEIAMELYQLLTKKKCFVVLDDIWTKEAWDCLCAGFPDGNTESKILLTTRNKIVALHVDPDCIIHSPRCLNESQSWELFHDVAIRHREGFTFNEYLEELGRRIVNRCGGLPLAIKTIGGILRTKSALHDWTLVYNSMLLHLRGIDSGMKELGLTNLLVLSYYDLPYQLKQCFLHLSQFPEDFIISANTVINFWVAEGIILNGSRAEGLAIVEVEDVAYAFLEDLVSRCMIQAEKWSSTGRIKSFRLHDLMRDLCIQEARKENFFHAKYLEDRNDDEASCSSAVMQPTSTGKFRRLALYLKDSSHDPCLNYDRYAHIRSLLVFGALNNTVRMPYTLLAAVAERFKYLRILCLEAIRVGDEVPKQIGDLVHLRLLDIGSEWTFGFTSSVGKLTQLLTLKLDRVHLNIEGEQGSISNIIENMDHLRHLYLPPYGYFSDKRHVILRLSHLRDLQTLVNLPLLYVEIDDLVGLPSLKKLKLRTSNTEQFGRLVQMFSISRITTFKKLQCLSISFGYYAAVAIEITKVAASCPHLQELKLAGPLVLDLPDGSSQIFQNLNKLTLRHSNLVEDPMPALGKLPNLMDLRLHSALETDAIIFPSNSFPCLKSLVLSQEEHLKEWTIEEGALSCLSFLKLYFCINLRSVPEGLRSINALQELQIVDMPLAFTERIKRGGEDFHKVENVPSLLLEINLQSIR